MMKNLLNRPITAIVGAYWAMFWLLNALDKVFARQDLGFVFWYGNHRVEKFTMYFDRLGYGPDGVWPALLFAGLVELAVALMFVWALVKIAKGTLGAIRLHDRAIAASIVVFFGFGVFDVVVGDRAELLEHSTYVGVLLVSYLAGAMEGVFLHLRKLDNKVAPTS